MPPGISPWRLLAVPRRGLGGFAAGRGHRGLRFAVEPARIARLGNGGSRRHPHQHRAARPLHHRRRQSHVPHHRSAANGLLVGIFVDDRRNPHEHDTYLAEQGEIVKTDNRSFIVLEGGSIQRSRPASTIPASSNSTAIRSICRSSPAVRRASSTRSVKNTSGNCCGRGPTTRSTPPSPINTGPSCTTG